MGWASPRPQKYLDYFLKHSLSNVVSVYSRAIAINLEGVKMSLRTRALAAYFRAASKDGIGEVIQPSYSEVTHKDLQYIVLDNSRGTLAVYRIRTVNGEQVLKGLKRWPADVAPPVKR